ncbi:unnamed protein product [Acanthoscelides obtectus]|uniref:Cytochrome P450 n=1 Tax=Acanthoscelides obtectus TaxID=200917 RepID=A0A9P0L8H0_ACAOB|nr:unnamed protein product [Acanthoscelides obtectus]CAK1659173.1 Cytochrome P450 6k1 [Acanthoscelides obtectus]
MSITSSWIIDLVILFATVSLVAYKYATRKFDYWKKRNVYHLKPLPFIGNFKDVSLFKVTIGEWLKQMYDSTDEPYFGIFVYDEPHLVIKDPQLIKQILVKDANSFPDRTNAAPQHNEIIANLLFFQKSPNWKVYRSKISPAFTSGKLKLMFHSINEISQNLNRYIEKHLGDIEAKEVCAKFSTEAIARCAFGLKAHCFEDENAAFRKVGRRLFDFSWRNAIIQSAYFFRPDWVSWLHLDFFDKQVSDYMIEVFSNVMKQREDTNTKGNDFLDMLIELKKNQDLKEKYSFEGNKVIAQAFQFFLAGFETTSSLISFTLYELCKNPKYQNTVREEIKTTIDKDGGITYENVMGMKYLDMCVQGERFGLLATKLALVRILSEFEVVRNMKTPDVIDFTPKSFILQSKIGLPMKIKKITSTPA